MNNFIFITPEELIKKHPDTDRSLEELKELAAQPDRTCDVCEQENVWKYGDLDMCFSCTTGEWDASGDYELI